METFIDLKMADGEVVYFNVKKSEHDTSNYRSIKLQNGLKILLISDELTDKAAASVDVHIGILYRTPNFNYF